MKFTLFKGFTRHVISLKNIEEESFIENLKSCIDFKVVRAILAPEKWIPEIQRILKKYFKLKKNLIFTQTSLKNMNRRFKFFLGKPSRNLNINTYFIPAAHLENQLVHFDSTLIEIIRCRNDGWGKVSNTHKVWTVVDLYNESIHSVTEMKPYDAFFPINRENFS
jgi:hypothetical protein